MPNSRMADAGETNLQRRPCGITRVTALWVLCRYRHNGHATGHGSRLGRDLTSAFGTKDYAREELVAEMGSAFLCATLGIVPTVRHADYIGAWLEVLREDSRAIFRAASMASKGADWLLARHEAAKEEAGHGASSEPGNGSGRESKAARQGDGACSDDETGGRTPASCRPTRVDAGRAAA